MIRHFLNPPNWFTSASIFCSSYALMLIASTSPLDADVLQRACTLIVFGGIFDLLDGRVARITNRYTEFGVQLDSIADIIGFGVAPAIIAYVWKLNTLGPLGVAVTFFYVLCAAFRLARFNVQKGDTDEGTPWELAGHSEGLTSTMAGGILVTAVWIGNGFLLDRVTPAPGAVAAFVLLLSFLMVSRLPMRNFRDVRDNKLARLILAVSLSFCTLGAVVHPSLWWGIGAAIYLTAGVVDGLIVAAHTHRMKRALMVDEVERVFDGTLYDGDDDL